MGREIWNRLDPPTIPAAMDCRPRCPHRIVGLVDLVSACLLSACLLTGGCASWEQTKKEIIVPLNRLVHSDYPKAVQARDTERVVAMFSPAMQSWARADVAGILARFDRIERARCVIHDAEAPNDSGTVKTRCVLRFDGISQGAPLTWEQERTITARRMTARSDSWRITAVHPGRTTLARRGVEFREAAREHGLLATSRTRGMPDRAGRTTGIHGPGDPTRPRQEPGPTAVVRVPSLLHLRNPAPLSRCDPGRRSSGSLPHRVHR